MEEENYPDIVEVCETCGEKTRMRFVDRKGEYYIYECSTCESNVELPIEEVEEKTEEEWGET